MKREALIRAAELEQLRLALDADQSAIAALRFVAATQSALAALYLAHGTDPATYVAGVHDSHASDARTAADDAARRAEAIASRIESLKALAALGA